MEQERSNGVRRNSAHHGIYSRPIERRPSKKSSSKDRHGMVYPDSFQQATIRTVTPDSVSDTGNHSSLSEPDFAPATTASPRSSARSRNPDWDRRREFSPYHSAGDEEDSTSEARGQRARSKTTTLDEQRSEISPSFLTRTRNRLGSINATTTPLNTKVSEESVGSIGYPSIIQSPTYATQPGGRQRLTKPPPPGGTPGLITGVSRNPATFLSPLSNADSAKILQLMKTTCGRMHGILSFRTASNAQWSSGYCAINVASGSLIYQAKGEVTQAKTLIPDLRGCHVRTLFDTELQSTYLSVSTFSSGLGLQLKPHVNETFDSWLAALLCWQPIRPKGVQNKRTKPQSVTIGDRRFNDSRRNSESTGQKDAAIIKIGNMLLWEKPTVSGARPVPGWKTLTYRQQKQNPAWQSVSGALHENGFFKLFSEASSRSEQSLLAVIQLSRLARCAVQQLEPSVLGGEYCIAIYPQYAAVAASDSAERPVFLSFETRVLFEVWFVLLRAFTIPELYGPETASPEEPVRPQNALNPPNGSITDMFRNERFVSIRITEAKLTNSSRKELDPSSGKIHSIPSEATLSSDYYAEVLLDGEVRAKTAVREKTSNPFWREDFRFTDLPPVLSNVSILLKTLNPAQKDWTLIAHGPYTLDAQVNPMSILDDLEVSSHDATCGRVDLHLDELESGADVEKWWPIIDDRDQVVGDMYMKVRLEETIVLMSHEYEPLSELLHAFPNNLTIHIVQILPTELNALSSLFLNIFQVSGQAADWIAALVEDEIDGFGRDTASTAHNRFRYTSRLHSNDSKESGQDREVIVRDLGRSATIEANLLFRGNSLLTKALDMHMRRLGKDYLEETIGERIRDLDESDPECEVDPMRVERPEDLERNWRNLIGLTSLFWKSIAASASKCPPELRRIFRHVRACAEDRYGDFLRSVTYSSVSGFLFLRFFCPAILNPKLFALMKEHPRPRAQRTLTLIAKALQGLANMTTFGSKEPWMEPMNKFLLSSRSAFKEFVDSICSISAERPTQVVTPQYATPIQILGRLPETSKEGFPSLPFLIDQARSFAALIKLWLKNAPARLREMEETDPNIIRFNNLALQIQQRTRDCFSKAEQAERPNGNYEVKWEELVESMDRSITFYDDASKAETPAAETPLRAPPVSSSKRNSIGYFPARPTSRRSIDTGGEGDEDTPPSSSSATWDQHRLPFTRTRSSDPRESGTSSRNSSQHSLENPEGSKSRHSTIGREAASKLRLFDLVPGQSRRKNKD